MMRRHRLFYETSGQLRETGLKGDSYIGKEIVNAKEMPRRVSKAIAARFRN